MSHLIAKEFRAVPGWRSGDGEARSVPAGQVRGVPWVGSSSPRGRGVLRGLARVGVWAGLVLALAAPSFAGAAAPAVASPERIDTDGVQDELESEALGDQLGALATSIEAERAGVTVSATVVDVSYGYEIAVTFGVHGTETTERLRCSPCGVGEAVAKVDVELRRMIEQLASKDAEEGEVTGQDPTDEDVGEAVASSSPSPAVARRRFLVGASTVGVGVVGVATGIVLAAREDTAVDGGATGVQRRTTRPIGYATLGAGLGLAAVGATLMVLYRPTASNDDQARFRLLPTTFGLRAGTGGVVAVGRF